VEAVALIFGILGFVFALQAQDEVKKLKKQINNKKKEK
jgi:hypothetical protein